jgi:hypothetical protein
VQPTADGLLQLEPPAGVPGAIIVARGSGCTPGATTILTAGDTTQPPATADDHGSFAAPVSLPAKAGGSVPVVARCGANLHATASILVSSAVSPPTTTFGVLIFFILVGGYLVRRQLFGWV